MVAEASKLAATRTRDSNMARKGRGRFSSKALPSQDTQTGEKKLVHPGDSYDLEVAHELLNPIVVAHTWHIRGAQNLTDVAFEWLIGQLL